MDIRKNLIINNRLFKRAYRYLGILIFIYLISKLDYDIVYSRFLEIRLFPLLLSVVLVLPMVVGKAYRWSMFLRAYDVNISIGDSIAVYFKGYGLGTITPGQVGELIKVYHVLEIDKTARKKDVFTSIINDRIYDLSSLIYYCIPFVIAYYEELGIPLIVIVPSLVLVVVLLYNPNIVLTVLNRYSRITFKFDQYYLRNMILSLIISTIVIVRGLLIFRSLSIDISTLEIFIKLPCVNLLSLIPISVSGFGTREAGLIYLFSGQRVGHEELVLAGILMGFVFFILNGIVGSLFILFNKNNEVAINHPD